MILLTNYLGIAALLGSGLLALNAWREFDLRYIYWADLDTSIETLKTKDLAPDPSYATTREALTRCMMTLGSRQSSELEDALQSKVARNCEALSKDATGRGAAYAEAHLIAAFRVVDLRDAALATTELAASQAHASLDRFNIEWRLILGHRLAACGSEELPSLYNCARNLDLLATHLPASRTLAFLREAQSPLLGPRRA